MSLPLTGTYGQMGYETLTFSCTVMPSEGRDAMPMLIVAGVLVPCAVMLASYGAILVRVRRAGADVRYVGTGDLFV